jgi:3-oxoacyl-[acyl-carrier protein] reductase
MDLGLTGRVALVAAGSKGLGRAVADELAAEGAAVVICARGAAALDDAVRAMTAAGGRAHGIPADVSQPGEAARVVAEAERLFGRVDILVTNAGGPRSAKFDALTDDDWAQAVRLLLDSAVAFARAAVPGMRARRWGRVLNITSIAAKQPVDGLMLSNSVRAAVIGFARTLATEVAPDGVTVNNLLPGYTRTARVDELARQMAGRGAGGEGGLIARWEREIPMGRLGDPREFAALAAFLASERASYITGQSIAVDGGWIRGLL